MPSSFKKSSETTETVVLDKPTNIGDFQVDEMDKSVEQIYKTTGFKHNVYQKENLSGGGAIVVKDTPNKEEPKNLRDMVASFRLAQAEIDEIEETVTLLAKQKPELKDSLFNSNGTIKFAFFVRYCIRETEGRVRNFEQFKKDVAQ